MAFGLLLAGVSALSFGMSGSIGKGLMELGWTPGSATLARVTIAALVLVVPGVRALRGDWSLVRKGWGSIVAYGVFAMGAAQLFYFIAVSHMDVSVALLIEYMSPLVVVLWLWKTRGQRPKAVTVGGAVLAMAGLVMLLGLLGGAQMSLVGVAWALGAMVGATVYWIISADDSSGLPPMSLAAGGLVVATVLLAIAAAVGLLPLGFATGDVQYQGFSVPWWAALLVLGAVTAALAFTAGIAAARRLGSRVASFVGLSEVVAAATFAWVLLGQAMEPMQLLGAVLVLGGVILVKVGEPKDEEPTPTGDVLPLAEVDEQTAVDEVLAGTLEATETAAAIEGLSGAARDEAATR